MPNGSAAALRAPCSAGKKRRGYYKYILYIIKKDKILVGTRKSLCTFA